MCRPGGAVQVNVNGDDGAVLLPPLQVQHHPHLAPGEGGAGVLPAPALVQALALAGLLAPAPLVLLAVGLVPAPHHLQPLVLSGHAPGAGREGGGEGQHGEVFWQLQVGDDGIHRGNKITEEFFGVELFFLEDVFSSEILIE